MEPRSRPLARALAGVVALLLAAAACGGDDAPADAGSASTTAAPATLHGYQREPSLEVGHVALPDVSAGGAPMAMRPPAGELLLVYFGYTSCPDICPTTMADIRVALESMPPELAERVAVAMVTVDPERDTDEVLTGYLEHFFDRAHPLRTDDPDELAAAAQAFTVQWEIEEHEPGEAYAVGHTSVTFVVDDTGTVVVEWPFGVRSREMAADLTLLLSEQEPT
ncbi:MAG TPA: SCO family protein [Acidimicrobiales bacterium]|nr:SCO family protein [Acidimicrobiales bacterium]